MMCSRLGKYHYKINYLKFKHNLLWHLPPWANGPMLTKKPRPLFIALLFSFEKQKSNDTIILRFVKIYLHSSKNDRLESTQMLWFLKWFRIKCFKYNAYIKSYQVVFSSSASICPFIYFADHCSSGALTNNIEPTVQAACVQRVSR